MKIAASVLIILAILAIGASWLVWINRASEKILTAVIPIGTAAVVGIFLSVFVFGGESPVSLTFPASFQYQTKTKMPPKLPWALMSRRFTMTLYAPSELYQSHPEYFVDPTDPNGTNLYGDLLQKSMIDWLGQHYRASWQSESVSFESSVGTHSRFGPPEKLSEQSRIYTPTEIQLILGANKFADVKTAGPVTQIAVPLATALTIRSSSKASPSQPAEILLKNKFCTLSIKSSFSWYAGGVGTLRSMSGLTDAEDKELGTATYTVKIDIEFSRLRSGHPKMPLYRKWAVGIAEGLRDQFDEQTIWTRTKSDYLFQKQVEQLGPIKQTWGDTN